MNQKRPAPCGCRPFCCYKRRLRLKRELLGNDVVVCFFRCGTPGADYLLEGLEGVVDLGGLGILGGFFCHHFLGQFSQVSQHLIREADQFHIVLVDQGLQGGTVLGVELGQDPMLVFHADDIQDVLQVFGK